MSKAPKGERFFFWLKRFNAIGIAGCLIVITAFWLYSMVEYSSYQSEYGNKDDGPEFGYGAQEVTPSYIGEQFETTDGPVTAYLYEDEGDVADGKAASGYTLVHVRTKNQRLVTPAGSNKKVVEFDVLYSPGATNSERLARGYLARIADEDQFKRGFVDVVVGNFPKLDQITVATNVPYVDEITLTGANEVVVLLWPSETEAQLISVDLDKLSIVDSVAVNLPAPSKFNLSTSGRKKTLRRSGNDDAAAYAEAPKNTFSEVAF